MTGAESLSPEPTFARALLTDMIRVRRMEEKCAEMYSAGKIRGFLHLYVGEEAVAAGSLRVLAADDAVIATYREHAHALLRGIPMTKIMAEMFGKQEGCSGGRGGSMHLFDAGRRFYGGNAVDYIEAALSAQGRKLVVVDDAEVDDDEAVVEADDTALAAAAEEAGGNSLGVFTPGGGGIATDVDNASPMILGGGGGSFFTTTNLDGRMKDWRVTKGVRRYTANFTVPSSAYPDS